MKKNWIAKGHPWSVGPVLRERLNQRKAEILIKQQEKVFDNLLRIADDKSREQLQYDKAVRLDYEDFGNGDPNVY